MKELISLYAHCSHKRYSKIDHIGVFVQISQMAKKTRFCFQLLVFLRCAARLLFLLVLAVGVRRTQPLVPEVGHPLARIARLLPPSFLPIPQLLDFALPPNEEASKVGLNDHSGLLIGPKQRFGKRGTRMLLPPFFHEGNVFQLGARPVGVLRIVAVQVFRQAIQSVESRPSPLKEEK